MMKTRVWIAAAALVAAVCAGLNPAAAQGVTTGAIAGTVTDQNGAPVANAQVQIVNKQTGFSSGGITRDNGSYLVQSLETGGPYTLTVRRIGFEPAKRENLVISLTVTTRIDVKLVQQAASLSGVLITASRTEDITPTAMGTKTIISEKILERKASATRNLTDFIAASPQVSVSGPGFSAGGMSNRMNNVQIDGATERDAFGLGSTGQPGGQISAKAISIDAVKEFQILLAPYDVRQGNFGGLLLNAVTKSGTNTMHGTAYRYYRDQDYGRNVPTLRATEFKRDMYGFSLGGPIIKDRLHFFTANEWQRESTPVSGPYLGQPADATTAFGWTSDETTRFEAAYKAKGSDPGSAGPLNTPTPMDNIFGRLDFQLNDVHRIVMRYNFTDANNDNRRQTGRSATRAIYTSNMHSIRSIKRAPVVQIFSNFKNGLSNELFLGENDERLRRAPKTGFPQVTINYSGGRAIIAGADQFSQGNELDQNLKEITDNLTIPRGNHTWVIGTRHELGKIRNLFSQSSYGVWSFSTIDDFEAGKALSFRRAFILSQGGNAYFDALQSALYTQDSWNVSPNFNLTYGLRADKSTFLKDNSYALAVDSAYGHHETAKGALQYSPRVGFNWDVHGDQTVQMRGGIGVFVGVPAYVWMENAYVNNGKVITFLNCNTGGSTDPAPAFNADPTTIEVCGNGKGAKPIGAVNFLDAGLKFPQPLRMNFAVDRVLGQSNMVATIEGLYSRTLNQLFYINNNVAGIQGYDKFGRAMYGSIATSGVPTPVLPPAVVAAGGGSRFSEAITVQNQNRDFAYNVTAQLRKRYADNWEALIAYTYGHAQDVQSLTSSTSISNLQFGRTLAGDQLNASTTTSLFDQPHKVSAFVTRTLGWDMLADKWLGSWARGLSTDISLSYSGVSGSPHDYVYGGSSPRGDLNSDGLTSNDLMYVPTDATDPNQIRFSTLTVSGQTITPAEQATAFNQYIQSNKCLRDQRGKIMARNSCRLPWSNNMDLSLRQEVPLVMQHRLALQLDIFNFGNMLNKTWGQQRVSPYSGNNNIPLVSVTGMSSADRANAVPIVTYNFLTVDPNRTGTPQPYTVGNFTSNYWRMQLAARYSF